MSASKQNKLAYKNRPANQDTLFGSRKTVDYDKELADKIAAEEAYRQKYVVGNIPRPDGSGGMSAMQTIPQVNAPDNMSIGAPAQTPPGNLINPSMSSKVLANRMQSRLPAGIGEAQYMRTHDDAGNLQSLQQQRDEKFMQTGNKGDLANAGNANYAQAGMAATNMALQASGSGGSPVGDAASMGVAGASIGGMLGTPGGPIGVGGGAAIGAGVGAGVGLVGGLAKSRAEKRRRQAEANQKAYQEISATHQKTAQQQNMNIGNIMAALKAAFGG